LPSVTNSSSKGEVGLVDRRSAFGEIGVAVVAAEDDATIPNQFAAALVKEQITKLQIASLRQLPVFSSAAIQKGAEEFKQRRQSYGGQTTTKLCDASSRRYRCNVGFPTPLP
jgi:hypothetical protein